MKKSTNVLKSLTKQLKANTQVQRDAERKELNERFARIAAGKKVTYKL